MEAILLKALHTEVGSGKEAHILSSSHASQSHAALSEIQAETDPVPWHKPH